MLNKSRAIKDSIIRMRRGIHQHPELGYQEFNTSKLIAQQLDAMGVPYQTGCAGIGVVAELAQGKGPMVLLRADMDTLPPGWPILPKSSWICLRISVELQ